MVGRQLRSFIAEDLKSKMVFIGGPRQVGKTTLSKSFITKPEQYLNWDVLEDREVIKKHQLSPHLQTIVLDEIHKYRQWRMLIKGFYDKYQNQLQMIVTGSARLDHFRKGGDSLVGRYYYYRLHPFSLAELDQSYQRSTTERLLKFGGFPEPYLAAKENAYRRWRKQRISRVVYQDIRDLQNIREISLLELLVDALPGKVGSVLSVKSLQEDLDVSPNTVSSWLQLLENVYYCFRILPYGSQKIRAVKKSSKLYLWDWAEVENPGARFENMVAGQLLKYCHFLEDHEGHNMELRFIRDTDLREVDFVVLKNKKPVFAVECKTGEKEVSKHVKYFRERTPIKAYYQVHMGSKDYLDRNIRVLPYETFCRELGLP